MTVKFCIERVVGVTRLCPCLLEQRPRKVVSSIVATTNFLVYRRRISRKAVLAAVLNLGCLRPIMYEVVRSTGWNKRIIANGRAYFANDRRAEGDNGMSGEVIRRDLSWVSKIASFLVV